MHEKYYLLIETGTTTTHGKSTGSVLRTETTGPFQFGQQGARTMSTKSRPSPTTPRTNPYYHWYLEFPVHIILRYSNTPKTFPVTFMGRR